jgi:cell wall-associated NlpC family hydrolase
MVGSGLIVAAGGTAFLLLVTTTFMGQDTSSVGSGGSASCAATVNAPAGAAKLDQDQLTNAHTIVTVGAQMSVPPRGFVIAIATALQESYLRNLHYGDRDSVGLFQQRPSSGWGTVAELTDPPTSSAKFYQALLKVPGWQSMPLTQAAQEVQRSAFPLAYAKWESLAQTLVGQMIGSSAASGSASAVVADISCGTTVGNGVPSGAAGAMLQIALAQRGKPYLWGGIGPSAFDCSGLVVYSWLEAGHRLRVRTSEEMYQVSDRVAAGAEQPGDLLFMHFASAGPGHVMIVVKKGVAVEAPQTGDVVKLINYDSNSMVIGRLKAQAFTDGTVPS